MFLSDKGPMLNLFYFDLHTFKPYSILMNITSSYPNEKFVLGFCNDIQTERKQVSKLKEEKKNQGSVT